MTDANPHPRGTMILRTLAMPKDTNPNGDIFGGWIMAQMDIAGGIFAKEVSKGRVVTVAVNSMKFIRPVNVGDVVCCYGDVVCCYGDVVKTGTTSITLHLQVWVKPLWHGSDTELRWQVTEADFTYVAIDEHGKKRALPQD